MTDTAIRVEIRGKVQQVWYRGWTVKNATGRGLRGWVRNHLDGSVEALFIGPEAQVAAMIDVCHRGPPNARVEAVRSFPASDDGAPGFEQKPTE